MPLGQRVLVNRLADVRARVVDEDVQATEALARRAHEPGDGRFVGDVDAHRKRRRPEPFDLRHRPARLLHVARGHDDGCAGRAEPPRHTETDPSVATRHDRDPSLEVEHPGLPFAVRITSERSWL